MENFLASLVFLLSIITLNLVRKMDNFNTIEFDIEIEFSVILRLAFS